MSQQDTLRTAVELMCSTRSVADQQLLFAEALDELAREQALSPIHAPLSDDSRAYASRLRAAVAGVNPPNVPGA